jgi:hypothetical protein
MSQFKHTSWGRTRSPKNILSKHRAGTDALGTAKEIVHTGAAVDCTTENQRFLHVFVKGVEATDGSDPSLEVFGITHAAATFNANGTVNTFSEFALTKDIHGATVSLGANSAFAIIPILGFDKIRFKISSNQANDKVQFYAACSTF